MDLANTATGQGCLVPDGSLLRATIYPDSTDMTISGGQADVSEAITLLNAGDHGDFVDYTYTPTGFEATMTDQNGTTHVYGRDNLGRETSDQITHFGTNGGVTVDQTVNEVTWTYDDLGDTTAVTSLGMVSSVETVLNQVVYAYDGWGNVCQTWQADNGSAVTTGDDQSPSVQYTYDSAGRLSTVAYPDGGKTVTYDYNSLGELADIGDTDSSQPLVEYSMYGDGTIVGETHPQVEGGLDLAVGLDSLGDTQSVQWASDSNTLLDGYSYTYDAAGNVTAKTNSAHTAFNEAYTYDALDRLTGMTRGTGGYEQSWTLDAQGNWTEFDDNGSGLSQGADAANEVTSVTPTGGSTTTFTHDPNGNLTYDGTFNYTYDAWNRLVKVTQTSGETTTTVATYAYDGNDYRISKTVGTTTTDYYYNTAGQVLQEQQSGTITAQYAWDIRFVNSPICRWTTVGESTEALYYTTDANFNVTALVDGSSGQVVERYLYSAYGNVTFLQDDWSLTLGPNGVANTPDDGTTGNYGNEILFTGDRIDLETAVYTPTGSTTPEEMTSVNYYSNAREVSTLNHFLQPDPAQSGTNLYEYCDSSPSDMVDPTGCDALDGNPVEKVDPRTGEITRTYFKWQGVGLCAWLWGARGCYVIDHCENAGNYNNYTPDTGPNDVIRHAHPTIDDLAPHVNEIDKAMCVAWRMLPIASQITSFYEVCTGTEAFTGEKLSPAGYALAGMDFAPSPDQILGLLGKINAARNLKNLAPLKAASDAIKNAKSVEDVRVLLVDAAKGAGDLAAQQQLEALIQKEFKGSLALARGSQARDLLRQALGASKFSVEAKAQAHHILAIVDFDSMVGQRLQKWGINLNGAENGVWLPSVRTGGYTGALHSGAPTQAYLTAVRDRLAKATSKEDAIRILGEIRDDLVAGKLQINGAQ